MTFQREAITNTNRMYILKYWYPATTTSNGTFNAPSIPHLFKGVRGV